jgi:hypothetical protein
MPGMGYEDYLNAGYKNGIATSEADSRGTHDGGQVR